MRATGKGPATTSSRTPPVSGKSWNATASLPSGASRASCCARPRRATFSTQKSTRAGSGTATGPSSDQPAVLSADSWRTRRSPTRTTCCSWKTPSRSSTCEERAGVLAAGTVMPSCKHYPKELGRRLTERGRYKFRCRGALCAIAWKDRKPIHFLSNYHNPRRASTVTVNRRVGDRLAQLTAPQLVVDYTR